MKRRKLITLVGIILLILTSSLAVAYAVLSNRNVARPEAVNALQSDTEVTVSRAGDGSWYEFTPTANTPDTGFIIYPGGFVDPVAYAPIARDIAREGYLVVIVPMPLNLAVIGVETADDIIAAYPAIESWAIGGHSLGGAMAAEYIQNNPNAIAGLVLWAAYPAENTNLSDLPLAVVSIFGDADGLASSSNINNSIIRLPANTRFLAIPGGNHTQFGYYGEGLQSGDNPAQISRDEQTALIVGGTIELLQSIATPR
jgi:dienelactone hydrolase